MEENIFLIEKGTGVVRVNDDDADELTVDKYDDILNELVAEDKLELQPEPFNLPGEAEEKQVREISAQVTEEQDTGDRQARETFTAP